MKRKVLVCILSIITISLCSCASDGPVSNNVLLSESEIQEDTEYHSIEEIPEYTGEPYIQLNNDIPSFSEEEIERTDAFEYYSPLDELGRCGPCYANICEEIQPTQERGKIGMIKPSGWHTVKYNDLIDGNYLYNRCHLIGYQLSGENANECNLITGTRYMNVVGMLEFEDLVDDYVDETGNHVLYRVTPIFEGDNLVASGVQMEGWSVEDSGEGICFNVYCYNVQPYIEIDYSTGESWIDDDYVENTEEKGVVQEFIINTNTGKFHLSTCNNAKTIADHNRKECSGTVSQLELQGYSPCKNCIKQIFYQ